MADVRADLAAEHVSAAEGAGFLRCLGDQGEHPLRGDRDHLDRSRAGRGPGRRRAGRRLRLGALLMLLADLADRGGGDRPARPLDGLPPHLAQLVRPSEQRGKLAGLSLILYTRADAPA